MKVSLISLRSRTCLDSPFDSHCYVIVADLGHLTIVSSMLNENVVLCDRLALLPIPSDLVPPEAKKGLSDMDESQTADLMYDKFLVKLEALQVVVSLVL